MNEFQISEEQFTKAKFAAFILGVGLGVILVRRFYLDRERNSFGTALALGYSLGQAFQLKGKENDDRNNDSSPSSESGTCDSGSDRNDNGTASESDASDSGAFAEFAKNNGTSLRDEIREELGLVDGGLGNSDNSVSDEKEGRQTL